MTSKYSPPFVVIRILSVLVASLSFAGCGADGPEMVPVKGVVHLDGQPIEGASVTFIPTEGGRPATGKTDETGQFELTTITTGDGAIVGDHQVTVTLVKTTGKAAEVGEDGLQVGRVDPSTQQVEWVVPEKYTRPETSGLRAKVPTEDDILVLELSAK